MEQSPPSLPRTIIVVDDHLSDVSFLCAVLDAHALPYAVQVLDPGAPFVHLAPPESPRAPTLILLDRTQPQRACQVLWRRLTALWPAVMLPRVRRRWTQSHTAARPSPPRHLQWPRGLAWGVGLGLLVGLGSGAPWLWWADRLPRGPLSPPPSSDHMAATLLRTVVPAAPPAAERHPPAQSQTPAARLTGTALGGTPAHGSRPPASVERSAASLRPPAAAPPRGTRAARVRHTRRRYAPLRPAPLRHLVTVRDGSPAAMVAGRS